MKHFREWVQYHRRWRKDPLNPREYLFPADPEDPDDRDQVSSVLRLPKARPYPKTTATRGVEAGRVEVHRFRSRTLRNTRRVWLYRPTSSTVSKSVSPNLLVVFDGYAYLTLVPTPAVLDRLQTRGRIGPTYAVLIDSLSATVRSRELVCNPSFAGFLVKELLPWVESQLGQSFAPQQTVLVGLSAGGLAAAYAALRFPGRFGNVLSQSGSFQWGPEGQEPSWLPGKYAASPHTNAGFYLEAGILESRAGSLVDLPSLLDSNRHMRDVLRAKGYRVVYREFAGGHDYLWWADTLEPALLALLGRRKNRSRPHPRAVE
jgi:enterochelin esterase family protein